MTCPAGDAPAGDPSGRDRTGHEPATLPETSWPVLIELAAAKLSSIKPDDLPGQLRRFARFAPSKRAKPAAAPLRAELTNNPAFRQQIAELVSAGLPLAAAVADGKPPADASPGEVAALAYLTRPDNWRHLVQAAGEREMQLAAEAEVRGRIARAEQRAAAAEHDRAIAERDAEKLRVELAEMRSEVEHLRRQHRSVTKEIREVKRRERKLSDALSSERGRLRQATDDHEAERQELSSRLNDTLQALERSRRGARDARAFHESRMWLLLETISGAAQGLRRELALEPAEDSPADFIADMEDARPRGNGYAQTARALNADDPIRLDELLALPRAHLIVDGYNVTKGGWGELTLEQQRARLGRGLSGLAAQSGAEVTVVYDGAERLSGVQQPRGVRVLFSRKGQTADEVICALVRGEPNGRPVVVISSDKEVADGTRRNGAYPLSSDTLRRRLMRA